MANLVPRNNDFMTMGDRFFDNFFHNFGNMDHLGVDIKETDKNYEVKADLPGFQKEDLNVTYDDDLLTIEANHENHTEEKDGEGRYIRRERSASSFRRQFMLKNIEESQINAKFENGVLTLVLPKNEKIEDSHKKIEIN